jgi:hypothetical protein
MSTDAHPIVLCAQAVIQRGPDGRYRLEPRGAALLEVTIVDQPRDAALREAILTLLGLAVVLHDELDSIEASRTLLMVIGRTKPVLDHLGTDAATIALLQTDQLGARARAILGVGSPSAKVQGPPPKGAVSVRSLPIEAPRPRKPPMPGEAPSNRRDTLPSGRPQLTVVPAATAKPSGRR